MGTPEVCYISFPFPEPQKPNQITNTVGVAVMTNCFIL